MKENRRRQGTYQRTRQVKLLENLPKKQKFKKLMEKDWESEFDQVRQNIRSLNAKTKEINELKKTAYLKRIQQNSQQDEMLLSNNDRCFATTTKPQKVVQF